MFLFDVFCGSFETAGYHLPDVHLHIPALFEGQVVKKTGFLATKWALRGVTNKVLESKDKPVTISDLNNDAKGDFQLSEPCSKSKLYPFFEASICLKGVTGHSRFCTWNVRIC